MPRSQRELIEDWFRKHEDGAFCVECDFTARVGDSSIAATVIYTTKHHSVCRIAGIADLPRPLAINGRYGLPTVDDLPFIRGGSIVSARLFIGDADPPDILVFSWLREQLPITWYGVNDELLSRHGNLQNPRIWISLSDAERETVQHLPRFCPDYRELIGKHCAALLDDGFKIELEGPFAALRNDV